MNTLKEYANAAADRSSGMHREPARHSHGHRHSAPGEHEHDFEAQPGLPEALPAGETLLWQGSPEWRVLARRVFHVRKLAVYFALLLALGAAFELSAGSTVIETVLTLRITVVLAALALAIVASLAWMAARTTVYTITDRRVVMRIGIVLSLTFNLPFKRIASAGLHAHPDGTGNLPLALAGDDKIAFVHLWPHARPWRVSRPEPMLLCVPDAAQVARVLSAAWAQSTGVALPVTARADLAVPATPSIVGSVDGSRRPAAAAATASPRHRGDSRLAAAP